jgi:hypothetical protein
MSVFNGVWAATVALRDRHAARFRDFLRNVRLARVARIPLPPPPPSRTFIWHHANIRSKYNNEDFLRVYLGEQGVNVDNGHRYKVTVNAINLTQPNAHWSASTEVTARGRAAFRNISFIVGRPEDLIGLAAWHAIKDRTGRDYVAAQAIVDLEIVVEDIVPVNAANSYVPFNATPGAASDG